MFETLVLATSCTKNKKKELIKILRIFEKLTFENSTTSCMSNRTPRFLQCVLFVKFWYLAIYCLKNILDLYKTYIKLSNLYIKPDALPQMVT